MTFILKSDETIETPISGTPSLPDITTGLLFAYDASTLPPGEMASWPQSGGSRTDGNLTDVHASTSRRPVAVPGVLNGRTVARFEAAKQQYARTPTSFPGGGKSVTMPSTQAFLIRPASMVSTTNILTGGGVDGVSHYLATGLAGGLVQTGGGTVGELKASRPLMEGRWAVVISVFDGAQSRIYIDGVEVAAGSAGVANPDLASLPRITVGTNTGANTQFFDGDIAQFSIYSRALTPSDASALTSEWKRSASLA